MRIDQQPTACDAYDVHRASGQSAQQRNRILAFVEAWPELDWSIGELAHALELQKSTVSARVHELLNETHELVEKTRRKDRRSGITVRAVGLPVIEQECLF